MTNLSNVCEHSVRDALAQRGHELQDQQLLSLPGMVLLQLQETPSGHRSRVGILLVLRSHASQRLPRNEAEGTEQQWLHTQIGARSTVVTTPAVLGTACRCYPDLHPAVKGSSLPPLFQPCPLPDTYLSPGQTLANLHPCGHHTGHH